MLLNLLCPTQTSAVGPDPCVLSFCLHTGSDVRQRRRPSGNHDNGTAGDDTLAPSSSVSINPRCPSPSPWQPLTNTHLGVRSAAPTLRQEALLLVTECEAIFSVCHVTSAVLRDPNLPFIFKVVHVSLQKVESLCLADCQLGSFCSRKQEEVMVCCSVDEFCHFEQRNLYTNVNV